MEKRWRLLFAFVIVAMGGFLALSLLIRATEPSPLLPPDSTYPLEGVTRNGATIWGDASYHVTYYVGGTTIRVKLPRDVPVVTTTSENKMVVADGRATLYTNWRDFKSATHSSVLIYCAGALALIAGALVAAFFTS